MLPIFKDYRKMLLDNGLDLSEYDEDKLWIDRLIIKGFDRKGNIKKICRLNVQGEWNDLHYEVRWYKNKDNIIKPKNEDLETWEETYKRLENKIVERERESLETLKDIYNEYEPYNYHIILPTSMGKDSKLTEHIVKLANIKYEPIFNNTTCDSADVYREVKNRKDIQIITPKDSNGNNLSLYKMMENGTGIASRHSRWCCSIFKESGTKQFCKGKDHLMFIFGMRNEESATRSEYQDIWYNPQWADLTWVGVLPIRKWTELELWLYTIHNNLPINAKYKKGYQRVGCHICCPFTTQSTWILDNYWYKYQYNRFHNIVEKDFKNGEKWTRMNCTCTEYHSNWNGGQVRERPTDEVIQEFMDYKGLDSKEVAMQYFNKTCCKVENHTNKNGKYKPKNVYKKDEVAMNLKLFGRNINKFMCKKCLMKEMGWSKEDWDKEVEKFKQQGCNLF